MKSLLICLVTVWSSLSMADDINFNSFEEASTSQKLQILSAAAQLNEVGEWVDSAITGQIVNSTRSLITNFNCVAVNQGWQCSLSVLNYDVNEYGEPAEDKTESAIFVTFYVERRADQPELWTATLIDIQLFG
jgi:hypothetical protein